jgi:hypothetical protein
MSAMIDKAGLEVARALAAFIENRDCQEPA